MGVGGGKRFIDKVGGMGWASGIGGISGIGGVGGVGEPRTIKKLYSPQELHVVDPFSRPV